MRRKTRVAGTISSARSSVVFQYCFPLQTWKQENLESSLTELDIYVIAKAGICPEAVKMIDDSYEERVATVGLTKANSDARLNCKQFLKVR